MIFSSSGGPGRQGSASASWHGPINQPLGLTVYCWHVRLDPFARYRELKCHASTVQPCPASCVRGRDGDPGRRPRRLPDHVRRHRIDHLEGRAASADADPRRAVEVYGERYRANPKDADAALAYGQALRATGQRAQAAAVLEQATIAHPGNKALLAAYGRALADNGNFQQAFDVLSRAHTPDNPDWRILSVQGTALDQDGPA